jgi:hypothetical protein
MAGYLPSMLPEKWIVDRLGTRVLEEGFTGAGTEKSGSIQPAIRGGTRLKP